MDLTSWCPPGESLRTRRGLARIARAVIFAVVIPSVLAGCASMRDRDAIQTERVLAASGFRIKLADTPEKLAHLEALPQRKLTPHPKDGGVWYVYADAVACKCLYAGSEEAYQRYQEMSLQREISREQVQTAEMDEQTSMDWGVWGPRWD